MILQNCLATEWDLGQAVSSSLEVFQQREDDFLTRDMVRMTHISFYVGLNTYSKAPLWIWLTYGIGNTNPTPSFPNLRSYQTLRDCTTSFQMSPESLLIVNRYSRQLLIVSQS